MTNLRRPAAPIYRAYGLIWQMPLTCPEWPPAPVNSLPEVVVRYGLVPPAPASALAAGPLRQVTPEEARFGLPDVARLLVRGGHDILIDRREGADDERVRLLLPGVRERPCCSTSVVSCRSMPAPF